MASWSDLSNDVLEQIIAFLPLTDHHRFSAVCRNWRWVAKNKLCSPTPQLPWLVMQQEASGMRCKFFNLSENREYYIDIPQLHEQRCCGSSYGWLFIVDHKFKGHLLNPFTREVYELPEFPKLDESMNQNKSIKAILSDDPTVKSDFTAVFLYDARDAVFWRPGDIAWTKFLECKRGTIQEALFFQGRLYVIYVTSVTYAIELRLNPAATLLGGYCIMDVMEVPSLLGGYYLVDFMGELLFVRRLRQIGDGHHVTKKFVVQKININKERKLSSFTDLGDFAIFLGGNSPVVVDSRQFQGCRRNSIYFTDMFFKFSLCESGCNDLGVYDMKEGTIEPYYPPDILQPLHELQIWLTPNCSKL